MDWRARRPVRGRARALDSGGGGAGPRRADVAAPAARGCGRGCWPGRCRCGGPGGSLAPCTPGPPTSRTGSTTTLAPIAATVGAVTLDRLVDEAMLLLYAEERELEQLEALDARHATLHEASLNHTGIARDDRCAATGPTSHDFDPTLSELAALLTTRRDRIRALDVRRSRAVGVLADPATAAALLAGRPGAGAAARAPRWSSHLAADAVAGLRPARPRRHRRPGGAGAAGPRLVRPHRHPPPACSRSSTSTEHVTVDRYEVGDRLRTRVALRAPECVFPWCTRPARSCDADHVVAHADGGATCDCNLAPLCRRHHRLKTHAGWTYTTVETGVWLWSEPHGQQFLRDHTGTRDVTPPGRPVTGTGCRAGPPQPVLRYVRHRRQCSATSLVKLSIRSARRARHEANRSSSGTGMGMLATRWSIRQLSTLTLGLVLAVAAAPATADTQVFDDPVGDSTFVDISRVRVIHRDSVIVRVRSAVPLTTGQLYAFWIDAGHGRRSGLLRRLPGQRGLRRRATTRALLRGSSVPVRSVPGNAGSAPTSSPTSRCRSGSRDAA